MGSADYFVLNLYSLIENDKYDTQHVEKFVSDQVSTYSCPVNNDVEHFLRYEALDFTRKKQSITYLVYETQSKNLVGFYSLTIKPITIASEGLSKTTIRKLKRFSNFDDSNQYSVAAYLIAQFGKNFNLAENRRISGDELLNLAESSLLSVQSQIGCCFIFLECEDKPILKDFYEAHGYHCFGQRTTKDRDVTLLQYIKPF